MHFRKPYWLRFPVIENRLKVTGIALIFLGFSLGIWGGHGLGSKVEFWSKENTRRLMRFYDETAPDNYKNGEYSHEELQEKVGSTKADMLKFGLGLSLLLGGFFMARIEPKEIKYRRYKDHSKTKPLSERSSEEISKARQGQGYNSALGHGIPNSERYNLD